MEKEVLNQEIKKQGIRQEEHSDKFTKDNDLKIDQNVENLFLNNIINNNRCKIYVSVLLVTWTHSESKSR